MDVRLSPSTVAGRTRAPPSKSYTHRAILCAGYADGATVHSPLLSADTRATVRAVEALGGTVTEQDDGSLGVIGFGGQPHVPPDVVDCANSGSTMRLVTGAAALVDGLVVLTGDDSLRSRPQGPLLEAIEQLDGRAESTRQNGQAPLVVGGPIEGGEVDLPGDVSSQYVTALLMAGAAAPKGITIALTSELKSAPYVDITREVLSSFGVTTDRVAGGFHVDGGQEYRPPDGEYTVPGDFSSISYLLAAGAVAGGDDGVVVEGAQPSMQGDAAIVEILDRMGAHIDWDRDAGEITVERSALGGVEVGVGDTPDLLPTVAVLGAVAGGDTHITNCEHVRYKETDRVSAMATELDRMGAVVTEEHDVLTIHGNQTELRGADVAGYDDHRIIMALSVAALAADGETTIEGGEHVDVSFPGYFETLRGLGATVE